MTGRSDELTGGFTVVSGEKDGQPIPADRLAGTTVRFDGKTVTVFDASKRETYVADYEVDSKLTPWRIVMTATKAPNAGAMAAGLVEKTGDTVRLIYSLPGTQPPTEFKTRPGQLMFVMENRHKGGQPA